MGWFLALPLFQQIPIVLTALDIITGALPDKYCKWGGAILALANKLYLYGKKEKTKLE